MKISDMVISAILKKGIIYEARNCDIEAEIPAKNLDPNAKPDEKIKIYMKAEHMTLRIEK